MSDQGARWENREEPQEPPAAAVGVWAPGPEEREEVEEVVASPQDGFTRSDTGAAIESIFPEEQEPDSWTAIRSLSRIRSERRQLNWHKDSCRRTGWRLFFLDWLEGLRDFNFVRSTFFLVLTSVVILLNAFFTGYSVSKSLMVYTINRKKEPWLDTLEIGFCCFFVLELLLRLLNERKNFFVGEDWRWNFVDVILVVASVFDIVFNSFEPGPFSAMTVGRILRMARFLRLIRIARVMRNLRSLRLVVFAILSSLASLFWCFMVIGCIMYSFAVVFLHGATDHFRDANANGASPQERDEVSEGLITHFGGIYVAMLTLFKAISGGVDWGDIMRPLSGLHLLYEYAFIGYIFFLYFGVINIVVGACVATTAEIAERDREAAAKLEMDRMDVYTEKVSRFFHEADVDKSGTLSWEEFEAHMKNKKVMAYFQTLQIDVSQAHVLFELLDTDGSNQVTTEEFLEGCTRLRGQATKTEMSMLMFLHHKLQDQILMLIRQRDEDHHLLWRALNSSPGGSGTQSSQRPGHHRIDGALA